MIRHPLSLVMVLLSIEGAVLYAAAHPKGQRFFRFLPSVFWIYFLPMLAAALGVIDSQAPVYQAITAYVLPASLVLLLLSSDMKAILRLGRPALLMMLVGSLGIMLGMPLAFALVKPWVGGGMWSGFGALSGSWIGGSANMIAVKEAVGTPEDVFAPMVIVDTVVPYVWMGVLVILSSRQAAFDRWNRADLRVLEDLNGRLEGVSSERPTVWDARWLAVIVLTAVAGAAAARMAAAHLPVIPDVLSAYAWTVIAASLLGLGLSLTPARRLEHFGASRVGYVLLYLVLTSIGARAALTASGTTVILILAGCLAVLVQAMVLFFAARILRAPMFLMAAASQANIGGVASAPLVAAVYQPALASVGLLLAVFGNIMGTYLGIITAQLCRWIS